MIQPDPGTDGIWFMGYKVTNPSAGVWHYEYVLYNQNLDRAIQSFTVPLGPGVNISNIGFHAPPQEPGWANDGTFNRCRGIAARPGAMITQDWQHLHHLELRNICAQIKMPTRFASARFIISGSMPTSRQILRTLQ